LDAKVIATGFEQNGQQTPAAGQVASLTSNNNFINFCLTVNKPITNGQQIKGGSCNPAPMGVIASSSNMPSSKFVSPANLDTVKANTNFTITMALKNLEAGNFVNAEQNYYSAPQQVNANGDIIGHSHFVIQPIDSLTSTKVLDPATFAFFKGIDTAANADGTVSVPVPSGLPKGVYKLSSINTAANHQPCLVAVAQHGSLDDQVYVSFEMSIDKPVLLLTDTLLPVHRDGRRQGSGWLREQSCIQPCVLGSDSDHPSRERPRQEGRRQPRHHHH
jgi:hypothetical protein